MHAVLFLKTFLLSNISCHFHGRKLTSPQNHPKKYHLLRFYALTGTKKSSGFYAFQKNINFVMIYYEIQQLMEMLFIAGLIIIHPLGCTLNKIPLAFRFI